MQKRNIVLALTSLALAAASFAANADILFTNLGNTAPPATVGSHAVTPFATAPQVAIPDLTTVSVIPGNPFSGQLAIAPGAQKRTINATWGTAPWPGAYTGTLYWSGSTGSSNTLTLPANTTAFYFYLQNNSDGNPADTVTITTNSGATSGPVLLNTGFSEPNVGANGFAFHSNAGEAITSITIQTNNTSGFAVGNFGIAVSEVPATTCASEGYTGIKLDWCRNVCEKGYTGATLNAWIRRWWDKYHTYPYCAAP